MPPDPPSILGCFATSGKALRDMHIFLPLLTYCRREISLITLNSAWQVWILLRNSKLSRRAIPLLTTHLDIEVFNNQLNEKFISIAEEAMGRTKIKKKVWMTNDVLQKSNKRRELKQKRSNSDSDRYNYKN